MYFEPDHRITVSAAARALGLRRKDLQRTIADGRLATFEGQIRVSDLEQTFPNFSAKSHLKLAQLEQIKIHAGAGSLGEFASDGNESLEHEVTRLRRQVSRLEAQLLETASTAQRRGNVINELRDRLIVLQESCDKREAGMLASLTSWLIAHAAERQNSLS